MSKSNEVPAAEKLVLSVSEAAKLLGISARSLYEVTAPRGSLPVVRINGRVLYQVSTLKRWLAENEVTQEAASAEK